MHDRTHVIASSAREFVARDEPVLIATIAHQPREYGHFYEDKLWLSAPHRDTWPLAAEIVRSAGFDELGFVAYRSPEFEPPELEGFEVVDQQETHLSDLPLVVVTYRAVDDDAADD
jgi:hypothetical protein